MVLNPCLRRLLAGISILLLLVILAMLMLPGGAAHRGRRTQCLSRLRNVNMALQVYATNHNGELPPAYLADENGKPMHSWRVRLLQYIEEQAPYDRYDFNEPWNGPNNSNLAEHIPEMYQCPEDVLERDSSQPWTSYVAVVGEHTLWPGAEPARLDRIPDGATRTLLLVEVRNSGIHWMEPRDLSLDAMNPRINGAGRPGISSVHGGVANVMWADGHGGPLANEVRPEVLRQTIERDDGGPANADVP